jgi:hypothetical protein
MRLLTHNNLQLKSGYSHIGSPFSFLRPLTSPTSTRRRMKPAIKGPERLQVGLKPSGSRAIESDDQRACDRVAGISESLSIYAILCD